MAQPRTTDAELRRTARLLVKHKGDRAKVGIALGITTAAVTTRISVIRTRLPDVVLPPNRVGGYPKLGADKLAEAMQALEKHGTKSAAARSLGIPIPTFDHRIVSAEQRGWQPRGSVTARRAVKRPLPKGRKIARYILTCAQSDTKLHEPTWKALNALAAHYNAEIMVSTFTYRHRQEGSAKRGTATGTGDADQYDPRIEPFVVDEMVELGNGLLWNGHLNTLPTATDPLSGMQNYNGRASGIFPHAKLAMQSVAAVRTQPAKLQYTTGAATQLNYIAKKAGQKAEFDHVFGGLLVEVNSKGHWWVRQLMTDRKGRIYDLDWCATPSVEGDHYVVCPSIGAEAITWGDIHVAHLEPKVVALCWGEGGVLDTLRPRFQLLHDVLDFESRSHHNRRDPHKLFELHARGKENVRAEVVAVGGFLEKSKRDWCKSVVVQSNHDLHLERWLKEADWRLDPVNAEFFVDAQVAYLAAIRAGRSFNALRWAVAKYNPVKGVRFLEGDESFVICRDAGGGIECGLHGDKGPNGSRGSLRNLARIGRKVNIGHGHGAGIFNGGWQAGLMAQLLLPYGVGAPSNWTQSFIVTHPNGKRQMCTIFEGRWRA
jgi:hypothetical protein